jgi:hypothetical protein
LISMAASRYNTYNTIFGGLGPAGVALNYIGQTGSPSLLGDLLTVTVKIGGPLPTDSNLCPKQTSSFRGRKIYRPTTLCGLLFTYQTPYCLHAPNRTTRLRSPRLLPTVMVRRNSTSRCSDDNADASACFCSSPFC